MNKARHYFPRDIAILCCVSCLLLSFKSYYKRSRFKTTQFIVLQLVCRVEGQRRSHWAEIRASAGLRSFLQFRLSNPCKVQALCFTHTHVYSHVHTRHTYASWKHLFSFLKCMLQQSYLYFTFSEPDHIL